MTWSKGNPMYDMESEKSPMDDMESGKCPLHVGSSINRDHSCDAGCCKIQRVLTVCSTVKVFFLHLLS